MYLQKANWVTASSMGKSILTAEHLSDFGDIYFCKLSFFHYKAK